VGGREEDYLLLLLSVQVQGSTGRMLQMKQTALSRSQTSDSEKNTGWKQSPRQQWRSMQTPLLPRARSMLL
jgi:hypothetical protein